MQSIFLFKAIARIYIRYICIFKKSIVYWILKIFSSNLPLLLKMYFKYYLLNEFQTLQEHLYNFYLP